MEKWLPLVNFAAGIPVAILTAWVTVKLALRRFQSEKWFERRVDAYTKVIEALHFMRQSTERQLRAAERGAEIPADAEREMLERYATCLADLRRLSDMGSLIFSDKAIAILDTLGDELKAAQNEVTQWDSLDASNAAVSKALLELRVIAKRDLNA
ncbi:MAG: hypothetical protein ACOVS5_01345 [Oligoflexus sp.]